MVCRSVFSYQSGAVQAKYDGEAEQGDVMDDIIVCPLHEGGVDVAERLHSFFSHTARESGCMPFGNTHIEGTVGHGVHQLVHRAAGGHGGGYSDDFRIFLCQFYQRFPKHVLEKRRQIAGIRLEAFSGFRIELARCMPDIGILLGQVRILFLSTVCRCSIFGPCISLMSRRTRAMFFTSCPLIGPK